MRIFSLIFLSGGSKWIRVLTNEKLYTEMRNGSIDYENNRRRQIKNIRRTSERENKTITRYILKYINIYKDRPEI